MGFTKKTWLALALAIVLVLGMGVTANAATNYSFSTTTTIILTTGASIGTSADLTIYKTTDTGKTPVAIKSVAKTVGSGDGEVTFSLSSDSKTLRIYGKIPGELTITAVADDDDDAVSSKIVVKPDGIKFVEDDPLKGYEMYDAAAVGNELTFTVKDNHNNVLANVPVASSASSTVGLKGGATKTDANGKITVEGLKPGEATLTATFGTGDYKVEGTSAKITVKDSTKASDFTVAMLRNATGAFSENLDPAKTKDINFYSSDNTYMLSVPKLSIAPSTATVIGELFTGDGIIKNIKWESKTPTIAKVTTPKVKANSTTGERDPDDTLEANEAVVEFLKAGTAKIEVTVGDAKATFTFTVKNKTGTAIATLPEMKLTVNQYKQVKPVMTPADARGNFTFTVKNSKIATVGKATGVVKGVKKGTTTVTVKDSLSKTSIKFTVKVDQDYSKTNFAGISLYTPRAEGTAGVSNGFAFDQSIDYVMGYATYNGKFNWMTDDWKTTDFVTKKGFLDDLAGFGYLTAPSSTPDPNTIYASDDDVFMFHFAGDVDNTGAIILKPAVDAATPAVTVTFDEIAEVLAQKQGTIVMLLDSNLSNIALTTKGVSALTPAQLNKQIINSIAKKSATLSKGIGTAAANAGSYKQKFKVITATSKSTQTSNSDNVSYAGEGGTYNAMSRWFTAAIYSGLNPDSYTYMPADSNRNGLVTLKELYNYTNKRVKAEVAKAKKDGIKVSQSIAVYPSKGDGFAVYARKLTNTVK